MFKAIRKFFLDRKINALTIEKAICEEEIRVKTSRGGGPLFDRDLGKRRVALARINAQLAALDAAQPMKQNRPVLKMVK